MTKLHQVLVDVSFKIKLQFKLPLISKVQMKFEMHSTKLKPCMHFILT